MIQLDGENGDLFPFQADILVHRVVNYQNIPSNFPKLDFYPQTFRYLQNTPKYFHFFQKYPHLEVIRMISKDQTHPLKIISLSLKFWIFSLFFQNFDFFQFGPLTTFDFKNNYQINIFNFSKYFPQHSFHLSIQFINQFSFGLFFYLEFPLKSQLPNFIHI